MDNIPDDKWIEHPSDELALYGKTAFVYTPENNNLCKAVDAKMGVRFSNDIFLMRSFLDQRGIEYKEEELDDSPFGKGIRIKRDAIN